MSDQKRACFKCGVSSQDPDVVLHRFPKPGVKNVIRAELWAKFVFPNGPWSSQELQNKLYSEHRMLCSKHFQPKDFIDVVKHKLMRTASPSVHCDEVETPNTLVEPGPSHGVLLDISNSDFTQNTSGPSLQKLELVAAGLEKENSPTVAAPSSSGISNKIPYESPSTENLMRTYKKAKTSIPPVEPGPSHEVLSDTSNTKSTQNKAGTAFRKSQQAKTSIPPVEPGPSHEVLSDTSNTKSTQNKAGTAFRKSQQKRKTTATLDNKRRYYYIKSRKYLKKICQLRKTIKNFKNKPLLRVLSEEEAVTKLQKYVSPTFAILLQSQIKNFRKKPKGRRWTSEEKIMALRIYKKSPSCYRLLRRLFCLPAPSSLKKLLSCFSMETGINKSVIKCLKKHVEAQKTSDREFVLMFDEMSIKKHLSYNKKTDLIEGYQDHGHHGRTPQESTKALVFMVAGIRKAVKQPLAYYLSGANVTADRLSVLIKETLRECFGAGLQVSATVCDMGGTNRRALTSLGATENHPVINIDGREVVTLFDAPHLLKCFRNMFLKYDIKYKPDISASGRSGEGLAKWIHIKQFYEIDSTNPNFVFAPSLRQEHLDPNTKQKMKVNLAAQVLSHTVAAGIYSRVSEGELPAGAAVTANVLSKMDKLFDLVNSDTSDLRRGKPYSTNFSKTSPHQKYFQEMKLFFKNVEFVGCPRPPPSLEGWVWTINGIQILWHHMQKYEDVESLSTRRLQQDPLENLFGCIRSNCGSNDNPTTGAFVGGLKTAVITNLAHTSNGNVETDSNLAIIDNFKCLLSQLPHSSVIPDTENCELMHHFMASIERSDLEEAADQSKEIQACAYVCGFLIKNCTALLNCNKCKQLFEAKDANVMLHGFVQNKEYFEARSCLKYASTALIDTVENCATMMNQILAKEAWLKNIKKHIFNNVPDDIFNFLKSCPEHSNKNAEYIKNSVFHIIIKRFCVLKNRKYTEEASRSALKKKIEILKNQ